MQVKLLDLKGQTFNLTFEEESGITVQLIRQKLLKEYSFDSSRCYFSRSGKVLQNEKITKEAFAKSSDVPIIIFDSRAYPDKSYPKVDDAFQWNFSRYDDCFYNSRSKNFIGDDISEDDMPYQIDRLITQGIIQPNGIFSRILNISRSRNNQNSDDIQSESDDEDEQPRTININNINYDEDDIIPLTNEELTETYISERNPHLFVVSHDENDFAPHNNFENTFEFPERNFMYDTFNIGQTMMQPFLQDSEQFFQDDLNPGQNNLQGGQHQVFQIQHNGDEDDGELPPPVIAFRQNRIPFPFDNDRRHDDLNQQIIEGLGLNIRLTDADNQAISRLVQNGYDRATVIQVYEACDRNEEAAMNLLVSMEA